MRIHSKTTDGRITTKTREQYANMAGLSVDGLMNFFVLRHSNVCQHSHVAVLDKIKAVQYGFFQRTA